MIDKCDDCYGLWRNEPPDGCSSVNHWRRFANCLKAEIVKVLKEFGRTTET